MRQPAVVVSVALGTLEVIPTIYYGRSLATLEPVHAGISIAVSFVGTVATYLLILRAAGAGSRWLQVMIGAAIATATVLLQVVYFGIYREFATLPTVTIIDFTRQTPEYSLALFRARLDVVSITVGCVLTSLLFLGLRRGVAQPPSLGRSSVVGLALTAVASHAVAQLPFMSVSQQMAWLVAKSSQGPGVVNQAWEPDRVRPSSSPPKHPVNVLVFRLEEIAAQATTIVRPELPTMPLFKALADQRPDEVFIGRQHFANSTATDVSVLSIYTGLSPAADLKTHRHVPILWDYFKAAGYNTSLFLPFHLEWGDFKRRFNARPGEISLDRLVDARASGLPIVYDNSINDTDVVAQALEYQQERGWAEPFLQIVSLKMPHAIGEGARINKLSYGKWENEPPRLHDYYNGIRHNDILIDQFVAAMPADKRDRTVRIFISDHGTRLFTRTDGVQVLSRLDNYHEETTRVPFAVHVPPGAQHIIPSDKVINLKRNLASYATSNIDMVPTVLGLVGIRDQHPSQERDEWLVGRDLTQSMGGTDVIVQLNTGPLRRWDREHFGLLLDNGRFHYMFSMGRELLFELPKDAAENENLAEDQRYQGVLERARAIGSQVPELLRIQQKYKRMVEPDAAPAASNEQAALVARVAPTGEVRLGAKRGVKQLVSEHMLPAPPGGGVIRASFAVRVEDGAGLVEWQLRTESGKKYFVHVDTLRGGHVHRLEFDWNSSKDGTKELSVQLFAILDSGELTVRTEKPEAKVVSVKMTRELELVSLSREPRGQTLGVYHLDRFEEHACLSQPDSANCPNGYLVWGPYVKGVKGSDIQLRYDIDADRAGAKVWFDLSAQGGKERLARSPIFRIEEPGAHTFELSARLPSDVDAIEGRLNANGGESLKGHAIAIRQAELNLASPRGQ